MHHTLNMQIHFIKTVKNTIKVQEVSSVTVTKGVSNFYPPLLTGRVVKTCSYLDLVFSDQNFTVQTLPSLFK